MIPPLKKTYHKQLMLYQDPLGLLQLSVLPLVAPPQVVDVEKHHLDGSRHPCLLLNRPVLLGGGSNPASRLGENGNLQEYINL